MAESDLTRGESAVEAMTESLLIVRPSGNKMPCGRRGRGTVTVADRRICRLLAIERGS